MGVRVEQEQLQLGASGSTESAVKPPGGSETPPGPPPSHRAAGDK